MDTVALVSSFFCKSSWRSGEPVQLPGHSLWHGALLMAQNRLTAAEKACSRYCLTVTLDGVCFAVDDSFPRKLQPSSAEREHKQALVVNPDHAEWCANSAASMIVFMI